MNIQVFSPLEVKRAFTFRPYQHFAYGIAAFIPICFVLMLFLNAWIAAGLAFIPAFCLYWFLESRLIVIDCPKCGKDINTNTPWQCGFKGCRNENADEFPFIRECGICHYVPKAYECHHCGNPIYLTTDRQQIHAAKRLEFPKPLPPPPPPKVKTVVVVKDVVGDKVATQREEVRDLEHLLKKTTLVKEIEIVRNKPVKRSRETEYDALKEQIQAMYIRRMSKDDIAAKMKAIVMEQFKNEPFEAEKRCAQIDEIITEML